MGHIAMLAFVWFEGELIALVALGTLAFLLLSASVLAWWLVRKFRGRAKGKTWILGIAPFAFVALLVYGEYLREKPNSGPPYVVSAKQVHDQTVGRPEYAAFGINGLAFFHQRLYAASNAGLIEIVNGAVTRSYCPQKRDCVVSGPWIDEADGLLWIMDDDTHELLNFDGTVWKRLPMPTLTHGYYSRGNVLEGGRFAGDGTSFWMVAAGTMWRWNQLSGKWVEIAFAESDMHDFKRVNELIGVIPLRGEPRGILRHQPLAYLTNEGQTPESDRVGSFHNEWKEMPNDNGLVFLTDTSEPVKSGGYICTTDGRLLQVGETGVSLFQAPISPFQTPGVCESLGRDVGGQLLASFKQLGIFVLGEGKWQRIAEHPYPSGQGEYWTHLAVDKDQIALAVEAKPVIDHLSQDTKFIHNAPSALWVGRGGTLTKVPF